MAIVSTLSNHFKYQRDIGKINLASDALMFILMNNTFAFDKDAHAVLSDVAADQLATANGYTKNNIILANGAVSEDDANDRSEYTADNVTVTASGGDVGPTGASVIIDKASIEAVEFFTTEIDRTFTGGSTHWANGDIGTTFDEITDLSLVASAIGQYCGIPFTGIGTALVAGGLYRLQYDYAETTAGFEFKINGAALQSLGDAVPGTAQTIDFFADESFADAHELRIYSKTNAAAAGDFDNFSLKELGVVVGAVDYGQDYTIADGSSLQFQTLAIRSA